MTRILLVDDHAIMRQGLRSLLEKEPDMKVVAEAADGQAGLNLARQHAPDVVVMDVGMPGLNGIEATGQILATAPATKVIGLSMHTDRQFVVRMLRAGAVGYVPKDCTLDELVHGIRAVVANQMYLSPTITRSLVRSHLSQTYETDGPRLASLTDREREVLRLLAQGKSTREISVQLGISPKTTETHRRHICEKLNLHTLADLVKYAIREGLVSTE
ncbi:MAG: response regulator transcription factor [Chloroflexi bacterium]|nr:response regulator transcription factor [Chloroflexota bacterium]